MDARVERVTVELDGDGDACSNEDGCWVAGGAGEHPPESRTEGSTGRGPSIAHLFDSYLERINDSILCS